MKRILTFIFFINSLIGFAQQDTTTVYVDEDLNVIKNSKKAAFVYRSFQIDKENWIINTYDKNNELLKKETYSDSSLLLANGLAVEYYRGKPILKGMYFQGKRKGNWITYDTLGHVIKMVGYLGGRMHGPYKEYTAEGNKREEGNYDWNAKKGEWKLYHENNKVAAIEVFEGENRGILSAQYFDKEGNPTTKEKIRTAPSFSSAPRGFYDFVSRRIVSLHPNMLTIVGSVECTFIVNKKGQVGNLKVISHHGNFLREAKIAILESPKWKPGTLFGELVDTENTIIITFVR